MTQLDQPQIETRVDEILNRWPSVGLALGVVRDGRLEFFRGHGNANIASRTPITQDTEFRIGSISKTFTAIAIMQLYEQGLIDLDAPANTYLKAFQLVPARKSFRPATVRHLLTHTAGVPQSVHPTHMVRTGWFGESVKLGKPVPTLADYYGGTLRLAVEPGTTFTYSDHGFAVLGQIVEDVSGLRLDRYLREQIFQPLGMTDTDLNRSKQVESHLATGYAMRTGGAKPIIDREAVTAAAGSVYSTPSDIARYLAALLNGGSNAHGSVLKPATLATMFQPHYQPDPRVAGFGLGFFLGNLGGHRAVEHQGVMPGFHSQIFLAPDDGVAIMAFTNGSGQSLMWLPAELGRLLGHLIGAGEDVIRTDVPHSPEVWREICGWYRPQAQRTDMQAWTMFGAGAEVLVRHGQPLIRVLTPVPGPYRGFPLHPDDPDDPYVFRIDLSKYGIGTARVVFGRDGGQQISSIYLDIIPLSLRKRPAARNPRLWVTGALALGTVLAVRRRAARRHAA
jgi:CubicO group peptidase (beta-lactamase class C family)